MLRAPNRLACLAIAGITLALLSSASTAQLAGLAPGRMTSHRSPTQTGTTKLLLIC